MKRSLPFITGKLIGIFFVLLSYMLFVDNVLNQNNLIILILNILLCYSMFIIGMSLLFQNYIEKSKFLNWLFSKILIKPIYLLVQLHFFTSPLLTILTFIGFNFVPTFLTYLLFNQLSLLQPYTEGAIYIISVILVTSFAYFGNSIMKLSIESFNIKLFKNILIKLSTRNYTRFYTYLVMVAIYMFYNFTTLSNLSIKSFPIEILNVTKEVFVTFVAIDSLIQIYLNNKSSKILNQIDRSS